QARPDGLGELLAVAQDVLHQRERYTGGGEVPERPHDRVERRVVAVAHRAERAAEQGEGHHGRHQRDALVEQAPEALAGEAVGTDLANLAGQGRHPAGALLVRWRVGTGHEVTPAGSLVTRRARCPSTTIFVIDRSSAV